jgi:hypothetical protein
LVCTSAYIHEKSRFTRLEAHRKEFEEKWNFPNCVGALDGKHVVLKSPGNSGSMFYNYKGTFSIVLLALADANYRFIVVDVGGYGKQSDGGTFATSQFGIRFNRGEIDLPPPRAPNGCLQNLPHVFVADAAFPLTKNMLRPYPGKRLGPAERVFNYRLSRARRVIENAFGILANRFRVFHRTMDQRPQTADKIVKATCVLHNMLRMGASSYGGSSDVTDFLDATPEDDGSTAWQPLKATKSRASNEAFKIRDNYRDYFMSPVGQVAWQNAAI